MNFDTVARLVIDTVLIWAAAWAFSAVLSTFLVYWLAALLGLLSAFALSYTGVVRKAEDRCVGAAASAFNGIRSLRAKWGAR